MFDRGLFRGAEKESKVSISLMQIVNSKCSSVSIFESLVLLHASGQLLPHLLFSNVKIFPPLNFFMVFS